MIRCRVGIVGAAIALVMVCGFAIPLRGQPATGVPAGLKIVVITGEDAVNIIQQKTAVAPVVEVQIGRAHV